MKTSIYHINKGINKSIEFKGLKAQWIWWFAGLVISLLLLFSVMYICGLGTMFCLGIVGGLGTWGSFRIFGLSKKYGENGLRKLIAYRRLPKSLRAHSRHVFIRLGCSSDKS